MKYDTPRTGAFGRTFVFGVIGLWVAAIAKIAGVL